MRAAWCLGLLLLVPMAAAGVSLDLRPVVGYVGAVEPGERFHTARDVAEELGLDVCGGDQVTAWRVRVTAIGLSPLETMPVRGHLHPSSVLLTHDSPSGEVISISATGCMAGAWLDGSALLKAVGFAVTEVEEL